MGSLPDILLGCRLPQQPLFASSIRRKVIWAVVTRGLSLFFFSGRGRKEGFLAAAATNAHH
jgi:hypothetical protein